MPALLERDRLRRKIRRIIFNSVSTDVYQINSEIVFSRILLFASAKWYMLTDEEGKARIKLNNLFV